MEPIKSELPLAKAFNRVISKIGTLRIMSFPRKFSDLTGEFAAFNMLSFYETVLWEQWLHGVFKRLEEWENTINKYFDEYDGSWEYYALSKRLDFLNEYGSEDDEDYNPDGTIKTQGITNEQLRYYTVFNDLYHDCVDIVQDTKPDDLNSLISALDASSQISIADILQQVSGTKIESYISDENGRFRPTTFVDKVEIKVSEMAEAYDLGKLVYKITQIMESMTNEIESIYSSDKAFQDNRELLNTILCKVSKILQLQIKESKDVFE